MVPLVFVQQVLSHVEIQVRLFARLGEYDLSVRDGLEQRPNDSFLSVTPRLSQSLPSLVIG